MIERLLLLPLLLFSLSLGALAQHMGGGIQLIIPVANSYSTTFPLTENPICENGNWVNGGTSCRGFVGGIDWGNVQTGLLNGTTQGVFGVSQPANFADPTAILTGIWPVDQQASATVWVNGANVANEVELRLRATITAHSITGYEIECSVNTGGSYADIVKWLGPLGNFAYVVVPNGQNYPFLPCQTGDILSATIEGTNPVIITMFLTRSGVTHQIIQGFDSTSIKIGGVNPWTSGNPGMGFYTNGSALNQSGFTAFSAGSN